MNISLCTHSCGPVPLAVLADWFDFLRGHDLEVIVAATGSPLHTDYGDLLHTGQIHKLIKVPSGERCFGALDIEAMYQAIEAASNEYVLLFKLDTLPFRIGNDGWLDDAIEFIERHGCLAFTGSFVPRNPVRSDPPYFFCQDFSNNFAVFKRSRYLCLLSSLVHKIKRSGPRSIIQVGDLEFAGRSIRFAQEAIIENHLQSSGAFTACRRETSDWSVFHVNVWGDRLLRVRQDYRQRKRIGKYLNTDTRTRPTRGWDTYYGTSPPSLLRIVREHWGNSLVGPPWRKFKRSIAGLFS